MARLLKKIEPEVTQYRDRQFNGTQEQFEECLKTSTTVYVGNLSFFTTEEQIYEVFTKVGDVMRIVMGLDKGRKTPCGFCFVVYYTRQDAELCLSYLNGTTVDDRPIRVDVDWGFVEGRQYGRGRSGGQSNARYPIATTAREVRDEYRTDYDEGRGGFGHVMSDKMTLPPGMPMMSGTPPGGPPPRPTGKRKLSADEPVRNPRFRQERADEPPADD